MTQTDLEARLRELFARKANELTHADLRPSVDGVDALQASPRTMRSRHVLRVAAAAVFVVGVVTAAVAANDEPSRRQTSAGDLPRPVAASTARAWPLTDDEPLPGGVAREQLATPEAAARAYLQAVAQLPGDWPLGSIDENDDAATVHYVLQDVPARVTLARDDTQLWYVTGASTEHLDVGAPTITETGVEVSVAGGIRASTGARVRLTALAADGAPLDTQVVRVVPSDRRAGAAAAPVHGLRWSQTDLPAAVRADVLSDHDGNAASPEVVVGHWSAGIAPPAAAGLPQGVDLRTSGALFTAAGALDDVTAAYMRSRFPDYPTPAVRVDRARTRGTRAFATWASGDASEPLATGLLVLTRTTEGWGVIAATTDGVDLSDVRAGDGRLRGRVVSEDDNALFADVLRADGTPVAGSPRPGGFPGADYRFGTAGGPGRGAIALDVPLAEPAVLRVSLVGGTILSISEVQITP